VTKSKTWFKEGSEPHPSIDSSFIACADRELFVRVDTKARKESSLGEDISVNLFGVAGPVVVSAVVSEFEMFAEEEVDSDEDSEDDEAMETPSARAVILGRLATTVKEESPASSACDRR
jgi:hypothetical protein